MRLVHFADTHLGFRQFDRVDSRGINRRELDVERTFHTLVDKVVEIAPDLIIIGGDVFHIPRPSNHAIVNAIQEFQRLVRSLPSTRIVLVAGNHDSPRSTETGGILGSFAPLGIHIVDKQAARIEFDDLSVAVLAIPEAPGVVRPKLEPRAGFRYNVMVMHGEVEGMLPANAHGDRSHEVPVDEMNAPSWDYIGLGHWHVYREMAPNMFYSGSINYTSSNPWGEMVEEDARGLSGKGFVERDLTTGQQTFHALTTDRPYLELPTFSAQGMTSAEMDTAVRDAVDASPIPIDGKAVRIIITECDRAIAREMNQKWLKEYDRRALNFRLDLRRAEVTRVVVGGMMRQHVTLEERLRTYLNDRPAIPGVNHEEFVNGAIAYLLQSEDPYTTVAPVPEIFAGEDGLARMLEASVAATAPEPEPLLDLDAA